MLSLFSNIKEIWGGGASSAFRNCEYSAFASSKRAARRAGGVVKEMRWTGVSMMHVLYFLETYTLTISSHNSSKRF